MWKEIRVETFWSNTKKLRVVIILNYLERKIVWRNQVVPWKLILYVTIQSNTTKHGKWNFGYFSWKSSLIKHTLDVKELNYGIFGHGNTFYGKRNTVT